MNSYRKRAICLLLPAAILGLILASSHYMLARNLTVVPVILAWTIYYIWGAIEKKKAMKDDRE